MRKVTITELPKNATFGQRLQYVRTLRNVSQEDLAKNFDNAHREKIAQWENDTRKPKLDELIKISDLLDVSLDFLIGRSSSLKPDLEYQAINKMLGLNDNAINTLELSLPKESINAIFDNDRDSVSYLFEEIENYKSDLRAINVLDKNDKDYELSKTFIKVTRDINFSKFRMQQAFQSLIDSYFEKELKEYNKK